MEWATALVTNSVIKGVKTARLRPGYSDYNAAQAYCQDPAGKKCGLNVGPLPPRTSRSKHRSVPVTVGLPENRSKVVSVLLFLGANGAKDARLVSRLATSQFTFDASLNLQYDVTDDMLTNSLYGGAVNLADGYAPSANYTAYENSCIVFKTD